MTDWKDKYDSVDLLLISQRIEGYQWTSWWDAIRQSIHPGPRATWPRIDRHEIRRLRRQVIKRAKELSIVQCVHSENIDLVKGKFYQKLEDSNQDNLIRVVDESKEDYLYPKPWFKEVRHGH